MAVGERTLPEALGRRHAAPVAEAPSPRRPWWARVPWTILAITLAAGALRFSQLSGVSADAFYDAAVRSMTLSLHNFLFGAFDPAGLLSVDKPPLDLWLQVLSVKAFGWGKFALQLPEALGGTLAVPLLYDTVRRVLGRPAGLAAAVALATLPESVLTSRSDTMDSVMMLLVIGALWLTVRAVGADPRRPRRRPLVLAGVALGLAFNVKLLQALLPLPALVLFYWLAPAGATRRRRLVDLACAGGALVAVGLLWAVVVTLAPGHHPWAVGSSDGSIWNAMFVFNGVGKLHGMPLSHKPGGPGPFRLLVSTGWHYDLLFGCVLAAALAVALSAAVVVARRGGLRAGRLSGAFVTAMAVWTVLALVIFDVMVTVHARYLEALSPALAALIGFGATSLAALGTSTAAAREPGRRSLPSLPGIAVALGATCAYTLGLRASLAWGAAALILAAVGAGLLARAGGRLGWAARWTCAGLIVATILVFPVHESLSLVRAGANDSLGLATAPPDDQAALSAYLRPRTAGLRYELAVDEPLSLAPLITHDQRPLLPLTSFGGRPLIGLAGLRAAVAAGQVRYGLIGAYHCGIRQARWAACTPAARWIRRNGVDVTQTAGLSGRSRLYLIVPHAR